MNTRRALLATLLLMDQVLTRQPTVLWFLTLWTTAAATYVGSGAPLW